MVVMSQDRIILAIKINISIDDSKPRIFMSIFLCNSSESKY